MAVRIAQIFLDLPWNEVRLELGRGVSLGRLHVPTDPQMRLLVDYLGPSGAFPTYSLSQVLAGTVPQSVFRDRIVLIGANVAGTRDTFASPFTAVMPGVERLATVIDSMLRELTVLFSDLRGFTALSERLEPTVLTGVINAFLSAATEAVLEYGGTVDKYIGDAIMAFWNAPLDQPDHAALACRAALRILEKVEAVNQQLAHDGLPTLAAGIGINTGRCTVGNFGSSCRLEYSAVGDAVNVAARLEGETKNLGFSILLGSETAARVSEFAVIPLERVRLRGRVQPIEVHALLGDETIREGPSFRELRARRMGVRDSESSSPTSELPGRTAAG